MAEQIYEEYWKLTNAFTDYNGKKFIDTLQVSINFIDIHWHEEYSSEKYTRLQKKIFDINPMGDISIRKSINQLVKLWFINPYLASYHELAKDYLEAKTNKKREMILSRIVYSNSWFNKAVNADDSIRQINFLIQTLIENSKLSRKDIAALMLVDLKNFQGKFLTKDELVYYRTKADSLDFISRKYNQISHLINLLWKLEDLTMIDDTLYFTEDIQNISYEEKERKWRDPYLHRLYKKQLQEESMWLFWKVICAVEKLDYPILVASHIKPFAKSNEFEAYDPSNGFLLSRTLDSMFDLKYISFSDEWEILFTEKLSIEIIDFWKNYKIDNSMLTQKRKEYLSYHRALVLENSNFIEVN